MYYHQCMLFVRFMRDWDENAFRKFLILVEGGREFKLAFLDAYGTRLGDLWAGFREKVHTTGAWQKLAKFGWIISLPFILIRS